MKCMDHVSQKEHFQWLRFRLDLEILIFRNGFRKIQTEKPTDPADLGFLRLEIRRHIHAKITEWKNGQNKGNSAKDTIKNLDGTCGNSSKHSKLSKRTIKIYH